MLNSSTDSKDPQRPSVLKLSLICTISESVLLRKLIYLKSFSLTLISSIYAVCSQGTHDKVIMRVQNLFQSVYTLLSILQTVLKQQQQQPWPLWSSSSHFRECISKRTWVSKHTWTHVNWTWYSCGTNFIPPQLGHEESAASRDDVAFYPDYMVPSGVTCTKKCMKFLAPSYSTFCTGNNTTTYFFSCFLLLSAGMCHAFAHYTLKAAVPWHKSNQLYI